MHNKLYCLLPMVVALLSCERATSLGTPSVAGTADGAPRRSGAGGQTTKNPDGARGQPIKVGETVQGTLDSGDWDDVFADRSYTDLYKIRLEAKQRITVELSSDDFDTYLSLLHGPGDQIVDNDDISEENTNSQLSYVAQKTGVIYIAATTLRPGTRGAYVLSVRAHSLE